MIHFVHFETSTFKMEFQSGSTLNTDIIQVKHVKSYRHEKVFALKNKLLTVIDIHTSPCTSLGGSGRCRCGGLSLSQGGVSTTASEKKVLMYLS